MLWAQSTTQGYITAKNSAAKYTSLWIQSRLHRSIWQILMPTRIHTFPHILQRIHRNTVANDKSWQADELLLSNLKPSLSSMADSHPPSLHIPLSAQTAAHPGKRQAVTRRRSARSAFLAEVPRLPTMQLDRSDVPGLLSPCAMHFSIIIFFVTKSQELPLHPTSCQLSMALYSKITPQMWLMSMDRNYWTNLMYKQKIKSREAFIRTRKSVSFPLSITCSLAVLAFFSRQHLPSKQVCHFA